MLLLAAYGCGGSDLTLPVDIGAPAAITVVEGSGQSAPAGTPLPGPIIVKVADGEGNPVPGQQVVFILASEDPGGDVTPDLATTGAEGTATVQWILGTAVGAQQVVARVVSETAELEVRITASASPLSPDVDRLALRTQPSGSVRVGEELDRNPVVQIRDAQGNDVEQSGVPVIAAVASGGGALGGTTTRLTDGNGRAEFTDLRITGGTGAHVLIFAAEDHTSVTSDPIDVRPVDAPPPPPAPEVHQLTLRTQPSAEVQVGDEFDRQPEVQIRDTDGKDVKRSGVAIIAALASGSGTLNGTTSRPTDSNGRAKFTDLRINGGTGPHVLIFSAEGYASVTTNTVDVQEAEAPPPPPPPPPPPETPNQPPVANDDEYDSIEGFENILRVSASEGLLRNDRDPEGGRLTAREVTDPSHGSVTVNSDGSFTYGPEPSFFGDDEFTYQVTDAGGKSSTATAIIHVAPLNDRPRFSHRGDVTVDAGSGPRRIEEWARSISPGADNESDQILTFDVSNDNPGLFTSGGQPEVTRDGPQSTTGTLTFTPSGRTGTANVTVILRDNGGDNLDTSQPPATFRITIR